MRLGFNPKMFMTFNDMPSVVISFLKIKMKIDGSGYEEINMIHASPIHPRIKKKNLE